MPPSEGAPGADAAASVFAGAVDYYVQYRPDFPAAAYEAVAEAFALDGSGTLLDLGTGTGQIALNLGDRFDAVVAIDPSAEMLAAAHRRAAERDARNIEWRLGRAEELSIAAASVRLVTIGNALHWMDRDTVLARCHELVEPSAGSGIAVIDMPGIWSPAMELGPERWLHALREMIERHLGTRRRAGEGYYEPRHERPRDVLARSPFERIEAGQAHLDLTWTIEQVVGYLYSTSFANRSVLGDRAEAFEQDLRTTLAAVEPSGQFHRRLEANWAFGHRLA